MERWLVSDMTLHLDLEVGNWDSCCFGTLIILVYMLRLAGLDQEGFM